MSEAERNAQVEREVQQRLETERLAQEKDRLAQQQAELDAREKALAAKNATDRSGQSAAAARNCHRPAACRQSRPIARDGRARSYDTFYRKLEPLRRVARDERLRLRLATGRGAAFTQLATLHRRPLGLHRRRLDVGFGGALRVGHLSLRPLDALARRRLGLGAGR